MPPPLEDWSPLAWSDLKLIVAVCVAVAVFWYGVINWLLS